jgi:hypothetical protein
MCKIVQNKNSKRSPQAQKRKAVNSLSQSGTSTAQSGRKKAPA